MNHIHALTPPLAAERKQKILGLENKEGEYKMNIYSLPRIIVFFLLVISVRCSPRFVGINSAEFASENRFEPANS